MWLATTRGFFSVVCGVADPADRQSAIDPNLFVIRARKIQHLHNLRDFWRIACPLLRALPTPTTKKGTDYPYRMVVERTVGEKLIGLMVSMIDYDNFKDAAKAYDPADGSYHDFLGATWSNGLMMGPPLTKFAGRSGHSIPWAEGPGATLEPLPSAFDQVRDVAIDRPTLREQLNVGGTRSGRSHSRKPNSKASKKKPSKRGK